MLAPSAHAADEAPLVPLSEVAGHAGQTVRIEEVVKAVSRGSGTTTYLNFGDAYPRQSLSVKTVDESLVNWFFALYARPVEVTGVVEVTESGPQILLKDRSQIRLLPIEPGPVLEEDGEGPAYTLRLGALLHRWLEEEQYDRLEELAAQWRETKARLRDGAWKIERYYSALVPTGEVSEEEFDRLMAQLERWSKERTQDVTPRIAAAKLLVAHAWTARGSGWANTVSGEGWKAMGERLEQAKRRLDTIPGKRREICPEWAATMQSVALGEGWTRREYDDLFDKAVEREPEYYPYYLNRAYWLLPRWYGSDREWEGEILALPGAFGDEMRFRTAWWYSFGNVFQESELTWPDVQAGGEHLMEQFPRSTRIPSALALLAGKAGDRESCGRFLDAAGDELDMQMWISWRNVDLARKWIADPAAPPPVIFRLAREE